MRILILDDAASRHAAFELKFHGIERTHVYNYRACVNALERDDAYDVAYLDHDLGDEQVTGLDVARHIAAMSPEKQPKTVIVHSWNPRGAQRMIDVLREGSVLCFYEPFKA